VSSTVSNELLEKLLERLNIKNWDLLLVGDGSGSSWGKECGWGCVSVENATFDRRVWYGAMNDGTINFAEIMAYLQPLTWYTSQELAKRKKGHKVTLKHVHVLTDSAYAANASDSCPATSVNGVIWQVFKQFAAHGIMVQWHWIRRETVELNLFADQLSKDARLNLKGKDLPKKAAEKYAVETVYDFNPWG
jgi:hypothetical protein